MKFSENLPRSFFEILKSPSFHPGKFQKSEFGKFIPNFPLKHVITIQINFCCLRSDFLGYCCSNLKSENALAIEMRKHFTEAATETRSSNLCLAAIIKII